MNWQYSSFKFLFTLNLIHIAAGVLFLILALVQFTPASLDNASLIDFRCLNIIHAVTGAVGLHMICKNFGSVVAKSLYCLSMTLSLWTLCFYSDTLSQESHQFESMKEIRRLDGGEELVTDEMFRNHAGKLAVCSVVIILSVIVFITSLVSFCILEKLNNEAASAILKPCLKTTVSSSNRRRRQHVGFVALMKIGCGLATVCLGSYLEALYKNKTGFIKIGWHILAGAITFVSACIDLRALYGSIRCDLLNLKISLLFSVASAVLSLKNLDYIMTNYFVADVREYARYDQLKLELQTAMNGLRVQAEGEKREAFVKFVVHAAVVASLALSFVHSIVSAVGASSFIEKNGSGKSKSLGTKINPLDAMRKFGGSAGVAPASNFHYFSCSNLKMNGDEDDDEWDDVDLIEYDDNLRKHKTCSGILQCVCGLALISLCVISLVSWDFSRGYDGGVGVLWLACLFIASGLVNANRPKTYTTSVYVLSTVSSVLSFERAVYSANVIYQAASNPRFQDELLSTPSDPNAQQANLNAHKGRITFYSIETCVLLLEFFSSTWTAIKFTRAIRDLPRSFFTKSRNARAKSKGALCSLGFFHLLYAFVTVSVSIAAEVALWAYNVHVSYAVYSTNGMVVFAAVFVQWLASQHSQFLLPSAIMNVITASIAFFVLAPAVRDLYTLVASYRSVYETTAGHGQGLNSIPIEMLDAESKAKPIQEWIIGMNSLIVLLAMVEYLVSVMSGMICSYLLHHAYEPRNSSSCDLRFPTLTGQLPRIEPTNTSAIYNYRPAGGSVSSLGVGRNHFLNPTSKLPRAEMRYFSTGTTTLDDVPFYGHRSTHSLNRFYPSTLSVFSTNKPNPHPHYGTLPLPQHLAGLTNGRSTSMNDYRSLTAERRGLSRYDYH